MKKPVYLDYQATTPLDPRVLDFMLPYFSEKFGNPHSTAHRFGWEAEAAVDAARRRIAGLIGAAEKEILFTSGATESNNLVFKGIAEGIGKRRRHMVTVATEHKCVLESAKAAERLGMELTVLPVLASGLVDLDVLGDALRDDTALVSVMAVNNEIGVIQPLAEIGALARAKGALFHTDAAQGFGKIPLDVETMSIDLMSLSGHKIYGPKGVGALYVRSRPRVRLVPQMNGGGQQWGQRSGTLAPALCAGFGEAARLAGEEMSADFDTVRVLFDHFLDRIHRELNAPVLNGDPVIRYPGNVNMSFPGEDGDQLLGRLRNVAVSSGAACASAITGPSYVLRAIGRDGDFAKSALRIGFGRFTTLEEVDFAIDEIVSAVRKNG